MYDWPPEPMTLHLHYFNHLHGSLSGGHVGAALGRRVYGRGRRIPRVWGPWMALSREENEIKRGMEPFLKDLMQSDADKFNMEGRDLAKVEVAVKGSHSGWWSCIRS